MWICKGTSSDLFSSPFSPTAFSFSLFFWSFPRSTAFQLILGPLRLSLHPSPRSKEVENLQRAEAKSLAIPAFLSAFKSPFLFFSRADCQLWQLRPGFPSHAQHSRGKEVHDCDLTYLQMFAKDLSVSMCAQSIFSPLTFAALLYQFLININQ